MASSITSKSTTPPNSGPGIFLRSLFGGAKVRNAYNAPLIDYYDTAKSLPANLKGVDAGAVRRIIQHPNSSGNRLAYDQHVEQIRAHMSELGGALPDSYCKQRLGESAAILANAQTLDLNPWRALKREIFEKGSWLTATYASLWIPLWSLITLLVAPILWCCGEKRVIPYFFSTGIQQCLQDSPYSHRSIQIWQRLQNTGCAAFALFGNSHVTFVKIERQSSSTPQTPSRCRVHIYNAGNTASLLNDLSHCISSKIDLRRSVCDVPMTHMTAGRLEELLSDSDNLPLGSDDGNKTQEDSIVTLAERWLKSLGGRPWASGRRRKPQRAGTCCYTTPFFAALDGLDPATEILFKASFYHRMVRTAEHQLSHVIPPEDLAALRNKAQKARGKLENFYSATSIAARFARNGRAY